MKIFGRGLIAVVLASGMAAVGPATGSAAIAPPTVVTGPASQVTAGAAVVNGTVNPNGQASTYVFQYGPTTNYGSQTTTTSAGSGTAATPEHATLSGLISNSAYHFRIVATSPAGTAAGSDATFTTSKAPPAAMTTSPSLVTSTSAVVNGTVDPYGKATTYVVQYGPTAGYGFQTAVSAAGSGTTNIAFHATLSGLLAGTQYHYRVVATNADATTPSLDATLETTGTRVSPTGPRPAVSEAAAVGISAHAVQLNGVINPQGPTTQWYFEFGLTANYGLQATTQTMSGLGARPVNVHLDGLQSGSTYHYRLVAYSANGLYLGPDHTFNTKQTARQHATLVVNAVARRGHGVVSVTIHGRVQLPSGVPSNAACNGVVALQFLQSATVGLRHTQLRSDCTYSLNVHIAAGRIRSTRPLSVIGYFWGNAELLPSIHRGSLRI